MILIVFALVLLNGFFAMSEMSVMTSRKSRLSRWPPPQARRQGGLSEKPEASVHRAIGITVIGVLTGYLGGDASATRSPAGCRA